MLRYAYLAMATAQFVAAAFFVVVSTRMATRRYDRATRTAGVAFAVAWAAFALHAANDGARILISAWGPPVFDVYLALAYAKIWIGAAAIWGFAVYVAYLWTGRTSPWWWVTLAFAAAHALYFSTMTQLREPAGVVLGAWVPRMTFDAPSTGGLLGAVGLPMYFLPPMALAILFLALWRRVPDRTRRFRVVVTATAILVFQGAGIFHSNPEMDGGSLVFPILALLLATAGAMAYMSYSPPGRVRHWLDPNQQDDGTTSRVPTGAEGPRPASDAAPRPLRLRL